MTTDRHLEKNSEVAKRPFVVSKQDVATGQSGVEIGQKEPDKDYIIESVDVYCTGTAATASVDVQVAGVSVLNSQVTPVAGAVEEGDLVGHADRQGDAGEAITVHVTTDGTGTITDLRVEVSYRIRR